MTENKTTMPLITIREKNQPDSNTYEAEISFDNGIPYPITIKNPFSEKQEQALGWYFEEFLRFPFTKEVEFEQAAASVRQYGEDLFEQVFGQRRVFAEYSNAIQSADLQIEIIGSSTFHQWHWEALKEPESPQALALHHPIIRKPVGYPPPMVAGKESPTLNVLLVVARPDGKNDVGYRTISQPLVEAVQNANLPVKIDILRPSTVRALHEHLENTTARRGKGYYHLIHFDVHGAVLDYEALEKGHEMERFVYQSRYGRDDLEKFDGHKAFLFLTGETENQSDYVEASELANLLTHHGIPIMVLNACQSAKTIDTETSLASHLMQTGAQTVLAMAYSVTVSAAKLFMQTLYAKLFEQHAFATAIHLARLELHNDKTRKAYFNQQIDLEDWLLPVVYQRQTVSLPLREFTEKEETVHWENEAQRYEPPETQYGFVGRDLDVLEIENRLLSQSNLLLIQGMGGAGKTTLLHHLGAWWQTTHFVEQVFYFGYDEKAWTRQQIMAAIAQQLFGESYYQRRFQPLSERAQQRMLVKRLRAERHLLILDNLESITGAHLAIQHTLPQDEQQNLQSLLKDLVKGKSLILFGSRSDEAWLAKGTFSHNVYSLSGLDSEAASQLADKILAYHHVSYYREKEQHREDLRKLLKLLAGYPLALEVVLANLHQQTPKEVLSALEVGDESIDFSSEKKTESILRCIDYSYGNLSPEAQKLLLCLAPFTGVIGTYEIQNSNTGEVLHYTKKLQQQPILADLPFEQWDSVLQEAANWGLLGQHPEVPIFLRLQPILPYFLRNRLQSQPDYQQAVETAFREHYDVIGSGLAALLQSKEAKEKQFGQVLVFFEYENLSKALDLALTAQVSILIPYGVLSNYLDTTQDHARGLVLGKRVLARLEKYPVETLQGQLGAEFVGVLDNIAKFQLWLKQYTQAAQSYQKALKLIKNLADIDEKQRDDISASIYHQLGMVAEGQRQWQAAEQYSQKALAIQIEFNDEYSQASTYHQLGRVAQEQHQWQATEQYYQKALSIFINFNDKYSQASTYHQLGRVAEEQHQWQDAEQYYQDALAIYKEFNDKFLQASTYHNLGIVAQAQQQWQAAEQYYQDALAIYIEFNNKHEQASTYHQLGYVAQTQQQWQAAEQYYQKALSIWIEFNDKFLQAAAYHNLGIVAQAQQQWQAAEQYYQDALAIYIEFNDKYKQASTYHQLGWVAQDQKQWQPAKDYFLKALNLWAEFNDYHSIETSSLLVFAYPHKATNDNTIPAAVAKVLGISVEEATKKLSTTD